MTLRSASCIQTALRNRSVTVETTRSYSSEKRYTLESGGKTSMGSGGKRLAIDSR